MWRKLVKCILCIERHTFCWGESSRKPVNCERRNRRFVEQFLDLRKVCGNFSTRLFGCAIWATMCVRAFLLPGASLLLKGISLWSATGNWNKFTYTICGSWCDFRRGFCESLCVMWNTWNTNFAWSCEEQQQEALMFVLRSFAHRLDWLRSTPLACSLLHQDVSHPAVELNNS